MAQDGVSDVERLRERIANIIRDNVSGPDIARGLADAASHRADQLTAADLIIAALAVPINKIGEDARTYADGVEDAAKVADDHAAAWGLAHATPAIAIATAIRRLSTSTDKGVSNGR